jgi:hypothetical protein
VVTPLEWIEIPKCDNHRLRMFVAFTICFSAGCRLAVDWLDTVPLAASQSFTSFSFSSLESSRPHW